MTTCNESGQPRLVADANILIAAAKGNLLGSLGRLGICTTSTLVVEDLANQRTFGTEAHAILHENGIKVVPAEFDLVSEASWSQSLSDADVTCLLLAQRYDVTLLTEDRKLIQACESSGVTVHRMHWLITTALDEGHMAARDCLNAFRLWRADATEGNWYEQPEMRAIEVRCLAGE